MRRYLVKVRTVDGKHKIASFTNYDDAIDLAVNWSWWYNGVVTITDNNNGKVVKTFC